MDLAADHGLLDNCCYFLSSLRQHLVHVLRHRVLLAQVLARRLRSLRIAVQARLILLEEFLLHSDVMVRDAEHDHPVFRLTLLLRER